MSLDNIDLADLNSAFVFAVTGSKGGPGKTTVAVNFATVLANKTFQDGDSRRAARVLLVDMDSQGSSMLWDGERQYLIADQGFELADITCIAATGPNASKKIRSQMRNHDFVVLDLGGKNSLEIPQALSLTNIAVNVTVGHKFDEQTYETMNTHVSAMAAVNPNLECFLVLNRVHDRDYIDIKNNTLEMIKNLEYLELMRGKIQPYKMIFRSTEYGLGVCEEKSGSSLSAAKGQIEVMLNDLVGRYLEKITEKLEGETE